MKRLSEREDEVLHSSVSSIEERDEFNINKVVYYKKLVVPSFVSACMKSEQKCLSLASHLSLIFEKEMRIESKPRLLSRTVLVVTQDGSFEFVKRSGRVIKYDCSVGDCLFYFNGIVRFVEKKQSIVFCSFNLEDVFLCTLFRNEYAKMIREKFSVFKKEKMFSQNVESAIFPIKKIGEGNYGTVLSAVAWDDTKHQFAVKYGVIKEEGIHNYDEEISSYHEMLILEKMISPLISFCPNVPILYDSFVSDDCKILGDKKACIISLLELASGNLRGLFMKHNSGEERMSEELLNNCLFQVMVGLHCVQKNVQIMNFDVKAENVLYYKIPKGGCWKYVVMDTTFFLPNLGFLFVLNDFGLARSMHPDFVLPKSCVEHLRLGSRWAIIRKGKFWPIKNNEGERKEWRENAIGSNSIVSFSSPSEAFVMTKDTKKVLKRENNLSESQKKYLEEMKITTDYRDKDYYKHPLVIPPFEFYNDTTDVIRMFLGRKRTTQRKNHGGIKNTESFSKDSVFLKKLERFDFVAENSKSDVLPLAVENVLAGYFILSFFEGMYGTKNRGVIQTYIV